MSDAAAPEAPFLPYGDVEVVKRNRFQKIMAKVLTNNASTIPHVTNHDDADVTNLETYRASLPAEQRASPLFYLIKASVAALKAFSQFNSSLSADGESLVLKKYFNIGIAVDTPAGLFVPVIKDCDKKDIPTLAAELRDLIAAARSPKGLPLDKMSGACFSISSLGGIGGTYFTPIINAPEVAILGACNIATKPVWTGSEFVPRQMLPLSLSWDHRVVSGADAARFLRHVADSLGKPESL